MNKIDALKAKFSELGVDAVIVYDELNQHYISDFAFTDGCLLVTKHSAHLITDFRYYEMALLAADKQFKVVTPDNKTEYINEVLSNDSVKTLGFEGGFVPYQLYQSLKKSHSTVELVDIGEAIEVLRQIKTPEEIAKMQKAQDITDQAFSHVLSMINYNMTELDVAVELEYAMRKAGADGPAFDTISVSGDASALPHGSPRNVKLKRGFLTLDYGAKVGGYCSDMTRTVVIGKADAEIKKLYNTVLNAQLAAIDYIKEGADCGEADKIARDIIDKDYPGTFGHSLGHSVGLFIHEKPGLNKRAFGRKLRVGEILTVEPGIYLFGKYGCRIEDMVAVEKEGIYNFTKSTKELIEI